MITGHGGNIYKSAEELGCKPSDITDMSSNTNPLGPVPGLIPFLKNNIAAVTYLPEPDATSAVRAFALKYNIDPDRVAAGNGTTEFIYSIPRATSAESALILGPTYADYADACKMHNIDFQFIHAHESTNFIHDTEKLIKKIRGNDLVFICNPNNPTGTILKKSILVQICLSNPKTVFVVDESYLPFVENGEKESMIGKGDHSLSNVIILNSMSKIFLVPGLRIGFAVSSPFLIKKLKKYSLPWSMNNLAQHALRFIMNNKKADEFVLKTARFLEKERNLISAELTKYPRFKLFPSHVSFILIRLSQGLKSDYVCRQMMKHRILIRNCANFKGLSDSYIRISLKSRADNRKILDLLKDFK